MPIIPFSENKTLVLKNLISKSVPSDQIMSVDKHIKFLETYVKSNALETLGPIIIYSGSIKGVDIENRPIMNTKIMVQLKHEHKTKELSYGFDLVVRRENCLFCSFSGSQKYFRYANNKLTLYAFEHDIELTGETYSVVLNQQINGLAQYDVYMPKK